MPLADDVDRNYMRAGDGALVWLSVIHEPCTEEAALKARLA